MSFERSVLDTGERSTSLVWQDFIKHRRCRFRGQGQCKVVPMTVTFVPLHLLSEGYLFIPAQKG